MKIFLFFLVLVVTSNAQATLGEKRNPAFALKTAGKDYQVFEFDAGAAKIREYASNSSNFVFAIAWNGQNHPDFSKYLGAYQKQHTLALRQRERSIQKIQKKRRLPSSHLISGDFHLETFGHLGHVGGRAYLLSKLPKSLKPTSIE